MAKARKKGVTLELNDREARILCCILANVQGCGEAYAMQDNLEEAGYKFAECGFTGSVAICAAEPSPLDPGALLIDAAITVIDTKGV